MPSNMLDLLFPSEDFPNALMEEILTGYFSGESIAVDVMTNSFTVVSDSGYSQQTPQRLDAVARSRLAGIVDGLSHWYGTAAHVIEHPYQRDLARF